VKLLCGILLLLVTGLAFGCGQSILSSATTYTHTCDASAAVALDADRFVVANDEDNVLRIYSRSQPGPPASTLNVTAFLQLTKKSAEADLEAAARVGDRIFWISSHGTTASGKVNPDRQRFFATDIRTNENEKSLAPVGAPYKFLLRDLIREPKLNRFNLARAAETDPEKPGALNIEGLVARPEGQLLIGFRTPIPQGKALLVPLLNPNAVLEGRTAAFGEAILLDLNGLGIRSLEFHQGRCWIIAGHYDNKTPARLYVWKYGEDQPQWLKEINLAGFNPEALIFHGESGSEQFNILSDDGGVSIGGTDCKDLKDPSQKRFRSFAIPINSRAIGN
jgi:hypothetical protein